MTSQQLICWWWAFLFSSFSLYHNNVNKALVPAGAPVDGVDCVYHEISSQKTSYNASSLKDFSRTLESKLSAARKWRLTESKTYPITQLRLRSGSEITGTMRHVRSERPTDRSDRSDLDDETEIKSHRNAVAYTSNQSCTADKMRKTQGLVFQFVFLFFVGEPGLERFSCGHLMQEGSQKSTAKVIRH